MLANQYMQYSKLVSTAELRAACLAGKTYVDAPVSLEAVCVHPNKTTFADAVRRSTWSKNIRVSLSCNKVVAPRHFPARIYPRIFTHTCPLDTTGIEGSGEKARQTSTSTPLQCGANFDPKYPHLSRVLPYKAKFDCGSGRTVDHYPRAFLVTNTKSGSLSEPYGTPLWCHPTVNPTNYFKQMTMLRTGTIDAFLLGSTPRITPHTSSSVRFFPAVAPAPPGLPVCKRVDFHVTNGSYEFLQSGGDSSCSTSARTVEVSLAGPESEHAAQMACINEAARLKKAGQWTSKVSVGSGREFKMISSFSAGVAGRYCFGGKTPPGSNWTYKVDCGDRKYQSEWNALPSVKMMIKCRVK
jgi:hypothetical protein